MTYTLALLLLGSIACDIAGQVFFKLGVDLLPDLSGRSIYDTAVEVGRSAWLVAGIATYIAELILWLIIMSQAALSVAFPIAAANFFGVALASWWFLGERVTQHQWLGAGLITFGVALVAQSV